MCKKPYVTTPAVFERNKKKKQRQLFSLLGEKSARLRPLLDSLNRLILLKCDLV